MINELRSQLTGMYGQVDVVLKKIEGLFSEMKKAKEVFEKEIASLSAVKTSLNSEIENKKRDLETMVNKAEEKAVMIVASANDLLTNAQNKEKEAATALEDAKNERQKARVDSAIANSFKSEAPKLKQEAEQLKQEIAILKTESFKLKSEIEQIKQSANS